MCMIMCNKRDKAVIVRGGERLLGWTARYPRSVVAASDRSLSTFPSRCKTLLGERVLDYLCTRPSPTHSVADIASGECSSDKLAYRVYLEAGLTHGVNVLAVIFNLKFC